MESSLIKSLVSEVKKEILSNLDDDHVHIFQSPSAYDTAWVAMIPDQNDKNRPMFPRSVGWILENQKEGGFWGETNEEGLPTIDSLPATLACMLALQMWNVGKPNIQAGKSFIEARAEILVKINYQNPPHWFLCTFPAMMEMAETAALDVVFPGGLSDIFLHRQYILQMGDEEEEEMLPSTCRFELSSDGSLFHSPSAAAHAFISNGDVRCLKYLQELHLKFPNGSVPAQYPVDGELIRLCMVDHIQGLGLSEYFNQEIQQILAHHYSSNNGNKNTNNVVPAQNLFKDALAFRLLRMHGHSVHPGSFCWFLEDPKLVGYMEENSEHFISAMYSVYRATDLQFPGENELEEARKFALNLLHNSKNKNRDHNFLISKGLVSLIKYELSVPWCARLDRLYHRKWIEETKSSPLWVGKASFYRISCLDNKKLMQLALEKYEFQQSIFKQELEQLKGWSKRWGLSEMGFGREKTVYTYFAVASGSCLPPDSVMRLVMAKAAIIITVADDFYDMEASLDELEILTDAISRWDGEGLEGHSKTIFDALHDFVCETAPNCGGRKALQEIWGETFRSWMVERRWSITGYTPSMDEYLATGIISIAAHTGILPATTFFHHNSPPYHYHNITKLTMTVARLANDLQSYQKEEVDGKMNMVLLHLHQNPEVSIQDSIAHVEQMLEMKRKELLEHVFIDEDNIMPKSCRNIHLNCIKVFQMFFNSANLFDTQTALLHDINRSIFLPIKPEPMPTEIKNNVIYKYQGKTKSFFVKQPYISNSYIFSKMKLRVPMKFNMSFFRLPI